MSIVYLRQHKENICYFTGVTEVSTGKVERYVNNVKAPSFLCKSKPNVPSSAYLTQYQCKTMGYATTPLHGPKDFLRKNGEIFRGKYTDHKCERNQLPQIPKFSGSRLLKKAPIDFVQKNIKTICNYTLEHPTPNCMFMNQYGQSGLLPKYIFQSKYGRVPNYIKASKNDSTLPKESKQNEHNSKFTILTPENRIDLLSGLKQNWSEKQRLFQLLPVFTDTQPKIKHKLDLQKELRQLEQDIFLLEGPRPILIYNDISE